jgi:hypothetical protein
MNAIGTRPLCALACCGALFAGSASAMDVSINWAGTVGDPLMDLEVDRFRYDLNLKLPAGRRDGNVAKARRDCGDCVPATAFQMSSDDRLDQRLRYGYRKLGEDMAARLWDNPRGKRIQFDIEGRPGLGLVIPFH